MSKIPGFAQVQEAVAKALEIFYRRDAELIDLDAAEWSIAHRLAVYIEDHFPGWVVDCEFNRQGQDKDPKRASSGELVRPDIVVHRRQSIKREDNLLIIEIKLNDSMMSDVERRIADFTREANGDRKYQYQFGLALLLGVERKMAWFSEGRQIEGVMGSESISIPRFQSPSGSDRAGATPPPLLSSGPPPLNRSDSSIVAAANTLAHGISVSERRGIALTLKIALFFQSLLALMFMMPLAIVFSGVFFGTDLLRGSPVAKDFVITSTLILAVILVVDISRIYSRKSYSIVGNAIGFALLGLLAVVSGVNVSSKGVSIYTAIGSFIPAVLMLLSSVFFALSIPGYKRI